MFKAQTHAPRRLAGMFATILMTGTLSSVAMATEPGPDHPAVARYPGAVMKYFDYKEYEESQLVLSKPYQRTGELGADKVLPVEGAVTYIHYEAPKSASALQVFRNYQSSLKRSGYEELFVCERTCTDQSLGSWRPLLKARQLYLNGSFDLQYLAARRGNTYVSLAVDYSGTEPWVFLFVTEKAGLDDARMAVTGDSPIAKSLAETGRVDLYGFLFDTGKSDLKPGSEKTLGELAKVLGDNPKLSVQIVGHTDNVGKDDANLMLSQARAKAVSAALTGQYNVASSRLDAQGKGASAPVAPNTTEEGRSKNRRVEIAVVGQPAAVAGANGGTAASSARPWSPYQNGGQNTAGNSNGTAPQGRPGSPVDQVNNTMQTTTNTVRNATDAVNAVNALKGLFGR